MDAIERGRKFSARVYVGRFPLAVVAGDDLELDIHPNWDRSGAVGDLRSVEEEIAPVVGAQRAVTLGFVELGDGACHRPVSGRSW